MLFVARRSRRSLSSLLSLGIAICVAGSTNAGVCTPSITNVLQGGGTFDVEVVGDLAYVASDEAGLQIFDISDPNTPVFVGWVDTPGEARGVAINGTAAYIADGRDGVQVIDISDPSAPQISGTIDLGPEVISVVVSGEIGGFVDRGGFSNRLVLMDLSDPLAPELRGIYEPSGGGILAASIEGSLVYLAVNAAGFEAIDISDLNSPTLAGSILTPDRVRDIGVSGSHAYAIDDLFGLQVIDISDPTALAIVASDDPGEGYDQIEVSSERAYVSTNSGLIIYDISNPESPLLAGVETRVDSDGAQVAAPDGDLAVVGSGSGIRVFDVGDAQNTELLSTRALPRGIPLFIEERDGLLYAASSLALFTLETPDVTSPQPLQANGPSDAEDIAFFGDLALAPRGEAGVVVLDMSEPTTPVLLRTIGTIGQASGVVIDGMTAYIASGLAGLQVIDLNTETVISGINNLGIADDIAFRDDVVFMTRRGAGLHSVDVSDPANPVALDREDTPFSAVKVELVGNFAFIAESESGLRVMNISDPGAITSDGLGETPGSAVDLDIIGSLAYVADMDGGLRVFAIGDPTNPTEIASFETPGPASTVEVVDDGAGGRVAYMGVRIGGNINQFITIDVSECVLAPADLNGDGGVGAGDLAVLLADWGMAGSPADLDGDGTVGAGDLAILLASWGS